MIGILEWHKVTANVGSLRSTLGKIPILIIPITRTLLVQNSLR